MEINELVQLDDNIDCLEIGRKFKDSDDEYMVSEILDDVIIPNSGVFNHFKAISAKTSQIEEFYYIK